jgi:hypothetical protein
MFAFDARRVLYISSFREATMLQECWGLELLVIKDSNGAQAQLLQLIMATAHPEEA